MKKLIFIGIACLILLGVFTAGCINSDPIVGTWKFDPDYFDKMSSLSYDQQETYLAYRITFSPDGTGKEYYNSEVESYESVFSWDKMDGEKYELREKTYPYKTLTLYFDPSNPRIKGIPVIRA